MASAATPEMNARGEPPAFREAIFAQAENLESAASAARAALAAADLAPLRSGVLVFSGIGASWHALAPAVRRLRQDGRRAFAVRRSDGETGNGAMGCLEQSESR